MESNTFSLAGLRLPGVALTFVRALPPALCSQDLHRLCTGCAVLRGLHVLASRADLHKSALGVSIICSRWHKDYYPGSGGVGAS